MSVQVLVSADMTVTSGNTFHLPIIELNLWIIEFSDYQKLMQSYSYRLNVAMNFVLTLLRGRNALAQDVVHFLDQNRDELIRPGNWPDGFTNQQKIAICQELGLLHNDPIQNSVARIIVIACQSLANNIIIDVDTLRGMHLIIRIPQIDVLQNQVNKGQRDIQRLQVQVNGSPTARYPKPTTSPTARYS